MQRDVRRWNPDARSHLQARNLRHVDDESERGRLSRCRPFAAQGAQLQLGPLRQMAHLRMGQGACTSHKKLNIAATRNRDSRFNEHF